jgi:putative ABC transport system substrate-binding protein
MKRREFITLLGGAVLSWPVVARAQQSERMRRIGVLLPSAADDADFQTFFGAFLQALAQLGWTIGGNVRVDVRWATANAASIRKHAAELVALAPDVILVHGGSTVSPMQQATRTIPIVFTVAGDPVAAGFADSLARPGGNITGFMNAEYSMAGKWLELLKQVAPSVTRVAILRDPRVPSGLGQFSAIQTAAVSLRVEVSPINVRDISEIERGVAAFARSPNSGLIVIGSSLAQQQRNPIVSLATRHKLPAVYFTRLFVSAEAWFPWCRLHRSVPPCRRMSIASSRARSQANPNSGAGEIPDGGQSEGCQGNWPNDPALRAHQRRRGDRVTMLFAAVHESGSVHVASFPSA